MLHAPRKVEVRIRQVDQDGILRDFIGDEFLVREDHRDGHRRFQRAPPLRLIKVARRLFADGDHHNDFVTREERRRKRPSRRPSNRPKWATKSTSLACEI